MPIHEMTFHDEGDAQGLASVPLYQVQQNVASILSRRHSVLVYYHSGGLSLQTSEESSNVESFS
jgi:hypothetical protein